MAFDGIVTKSVVQELQNSIIEGKVNKVFQPTKFDIILGLYSNKKNLALHLCASTTNCRINLTTHTKPNPPSAPNFCMLLRKHLIGAKILSISTPDLERIVQIDFECLNELNDKVIKKLYIEIMGSHSNIVLTNSNNIIIDSLKHVDTPFRTILPAREYVFPPNEKHSFINLKDFNEFNNIINTYSNQTDPLDKKISDCFIGLSRPFLQNIINNDESNLEKVYTNLKEIINNINSFNINAKFLNNSKDFTVTLSKKETDFDINFFVDNFYYEKEKIEDFKLYRNNLLKIISANLKKYTKRLENIDAKLSECEQTDLYKLYGELITANLYRLKDKSSSVNVENYYDNNSIITIPLDDTVTPKKNAEKYFKKYQKLKNTFNIVSLQKKETIEELNYIESIIYSLEEANSLEELEEIHSEISENFIKAPKKQLSKKEKNSAENILTYSEEGYTILVRKKQ